MGHANHVVASSLVCAGGLGSNKSSLKSQNSPEKGPSPVKVRLGVFEGASTTE